MIVKPGFWLCAAPSLHSFLSALAINGSDMWHLWRRGEAICLLHVTLSSRSELEMRGYCQAVGVNNRESSKSPWERVFVSSNIVIIPGSSAIAKGSVTQYWPLSQEVIASRVKKAEVLCIYVLFPWDQFQFLFSAELNFTVTSYENKYTSFDSWSPSIYNFLQGFSVTLQIIQVSVHKLFSFAYYVETYFGR